MINKKHFKKLYKSGLSQKEIAEKTRLSYKQVIYWMQKYKIPRRSRSEATYVKRNPNGDPFKIKKKLTKTEAELRGMGLGLYWGEGTKSDKHSIRLGNTDPRLVNKFIEFLIKICGVQKKKLKFWLQIFSDINPKKALEFWCKALKVNSNQFGKVIVTPSRGKGTYGRKIQHGVVTLYFCNKKLRDILNNMLG